MRTRRTLFFIQSSWSWGQSASHGPTSLVQKGELGWRWIPSWGFGITNRWNQPAEELKEKRGLRVELAPRQANCARHTQKRVECRGDLTKGSVCEGWSREMPRSVWDPTPVLLNLSCTWNHLGSFKNTDTGFLPSGILVKFYTWGVVWAWDT